MKTTALAAALAAALALPAAAQDGPSEDEIFGAPPPSRPDAAAPPSPGEPPPPRTPAPEGSPLPEEAELFGTSSGSPAAQPPPESLVARSQAQEDTLRIGGQVYLRADTAWQRGVAPEDWRLSSGNLADVFLDARPNDRVRAFLLGRMSYDPTLENQPAAGGGLESLLGALGGGTVPASNPRVVLDQLWLNFDLGRRVYATVGKQHVKWGVGKFWNPTDYLHRVPRDPLATFDARTGTTLVKLHVPWERRGWNLYGVAALEDTGRDAAPVGRVGRVAAGGRAEIVLGAMELGLDALVQDGRKPRFGVDVSAGVWELDLYAEAALRSGVEGGRWVSTSPDPLDLTAYERREVDGLVPQLVLGGSWSRNYTDEDVVNVGFEYFFNDGGYDDPRVYPFLLAGAPRINAPGAEVPFELQDPGAFRPFYVGRHYAGAFVNLPSPGPWNDTSFTLSVLGNLSDRSFVARLDHSVLILTYLRLETYVAGHLGADGGEFRLGFRVPDELLAGTPLAGTRVGPRTPVLDAGVALRLSL